MENRRIVESTGRSQASKARRHDDRLNYYYAGRRIQEKRIRVLEKKLANVTKILLRRIEQVSTDHQDDTNLLFSTLRTTSGVSELVCQQMITVTNRVCTLECQLEKVDEGAVRDDDAHDTLAASVSDSSISTDQPILVYSSLPSTLKGLAILTSVLFILAYVALQCVFGALTTSHVDVVQSLTAWGESCFGSGDRVVVGTGSWWGNWSFRREGKKKNKKRRRNYKTFG